MNTTQTKTRDFYDNFAEKLLTDFAAGNPRMKSALNFAADELTGDRRANILDLGCGIGWSTHEFSRIPSTNSVTAVDLSNNLVSIADSLFGKSNKQASFHTADITDPTFLDAFEKQFDACVLIDVYEHVPVASRDIFHCSLKRLLKDMFTIVITCPTPQHQEWLRTENPNGLQPTDEDISIETLLQFAKALDADVTHYAKKSVWNRHDYFHATITKETSRQKLVSNPRPTLMGAQERRLRLQKLENLKEIAPSLYAGRLKQIKLALQRYAQRLVRQG